MARLTAKQAKEISGPTLEEEVGYKVDALLVAVEHAAREKKRSIRAGGLEYQEDKDLWVNGGYSRSKDWNLATKMLKELGYKVSFYYDDSSQFVTVYTLIEW